METIKITSEGISRVWTLYGKEVSVMIARKENDKYYLARNSITIEGAK